jgi:hypothetical protein
LKVVKITLILFTKHSKKYKTKLFGIYQKGNLRALGGSVAKKKLRHQITTAIGAKLFIKI